LVARPDLRLPGNAEGDWFVDRRCIDCGTCQEVAPAVFAEAGVHSVVGHQPAGDDEELGAWLAAQACPTSSIGTLSRRPRPGRLYPREVAPGLGAWDLGWCSPDSFGASAWYLARPGGGVLVDSPRWTSALVAPLEAMGGVAHVVLTHRDDVADAARWAARFGARVWIHAADRSAAPFATDVVEGLEDAEVCPGVVIVPTPGHTAGSVVVVADEAVACTGDSLACDPTTGELEAWPEVCWWSWPDQLDSLERLARTHRFAHVLPGHGGRGHDDPESLRRRLLALVDGFRSPVGAARRSPRW
jgi:glyoxylase-like metal-dependent hydrolase (beta-lactamase superfamily II)/ferredoxin